MLAEGKLLDFKITCLDKEFYVHRNVLPQARDFIKMAVGRTFKVWFVSEQAASDLLAVAGRRLWHLRLSRGTPYHCCSSIRLHLTFESI